MTTSIKLYAAANELTYDQARYRLNKLTAQGEFITSKFGKQTMYTKIQPTPAKQKRTRINYDTIFVANLEGYKANYSGSELVDYFVENGIAPDRKNARVSVGKFIKSKRFMSHIYGYRIILDSLNHSIED
jgi:hypothetical protein